MNTFITDDDPKKCAQNLDYRRLGKQRLECSQILKAIKDPTYKGWQNHPCTNMWRPYEKALKYYANCMIEEWITRGYKNTMEKFTDFEEVMPWWFYKKELQKSHQASLLRKNQSFYRQIFDKSDIYAYENFSYIWPSKLTEGIINIWKTSDLPISTLAEKAQKTSVLT